MLTPMCRLWEEVEQHYSRAAELFAEEGRPTAAAEAAARGARALEEQRPEVGMTDGSRGLPGLSHCTMHPSAFAHVFTPTCLHRILLQSTDCINHFRPLGLCTGIHSHVPPGGGVAGGRRQGCAGW